MITAEDALALGLEVLLEADEGAPTVLRGTSPDRAGVALEIARFLMEYADAPADEDDGEQAGSVTLVGALPAGPARKVMCAASPGDYAYTRGGKSSGTPFVAVEVVADGESSTVALSLADARAYAAGILDAADEAEGGSPLLLFRRADGTAGE